MSDTSAKVTVEESIERAKALIQYYRQIVDSNHKVSDWSIARDLIVDILHYACRHEGVGETDMLEVVEAIFNDENTAAISEEEKD